LAEERATVTFQNAQITDENRRIRQEIKDARARGAALEKAEGTLHAPVTAENLTLKRRIEELEQKLAAVNVTPRVDGNAAQDEVRARLEQRAGELSKRYEALLNERPKPAGSEHRRKAIEETRKSLEQTQNALAKLTGAKGIDTVQNRDRLSKIAQRWYRDKRRWHDIFKANTHVVRSPGQIYPGMILVIP
jgi:nucleoid-associated protein YgaU